MPHSTTEVLKEALIGGYTGFDMSVKVICLSPFAVCAALASGSITVPTVIAIFSQLRTLPLALTCVGVGAPILFRAGQYMLSRPAAAASTKEITVADFEILPDIDDTNPDATDDEQKQEGIISESRQITATKSCKT